MNRVAAKFAELSVLGKKALIPYLMAGDPSVDVTLKMMEVLEENGADLIELGIPFSDPLADGPVIQKATQRALKNGFRMSKLFPLVEAAVKVISLPIVLMAYYNLILQYGTERFIQEAMEAGVGGLVIPDLPPEEAGEISRIALECGIALNFLTTPVSTPMRIKKAAMASTGFLYLVSVRGVTGERRSLSLELPVLVKKIKRVTSLPVAIGFGVSCPEQARELASLADGVIVGSAVVNRMVNDNPETSYREVGAFIRSLRQAINKEDILKEQRTD
jgi:tryptophan synthase alpha chain